ncbi:MAG: hypothetical protein P4L67_00200 [Candidatus Pacebacteria bacterium]|nr:hypothetical protein [Candidatus Paceibacterota bacterium]
MELLLLVVPQALQRLSEILEPLLYPLSQIGSLSLGLQQLNEPLELQGVFLSELGPNVLYVVAHDVDAEDGNLLGQLSEHLKYQPALDRAQLIEAHDSV